MKKTAVVFFNLFKRMNFYTEKNDILENHIAKFLCKEVCMLD